MKIVIVDNEKVHLDVIHKRVQKWIKKENTKNIPVQYFVYTSAKEALRDHYKFNFDVAYLDVDMPISGFDLADDLYNHNRKIKIFYVTSHIDVAYEAHKHHSSGFVSKSNYEDYYDAVKTLLDIYIEDVQPIKINVEEINDIKANELIYCLTEGKYTNFYTIHCSEGVKTQHRIKTLEPLLKKYWFIQLNKGLLVNLYFIDKMDEVNKLVYLINGEKLKIAPARLAEYKKMKQLYKQREFI